MAPTVKQYKRGFPDKADVLSRTPDPGVRDMLAHLGDCGIETCFDRFDRQQPGCDFGLRGDLLPDLQHGSVPRHPESAARGLRSRSGSDGRAQSAALAGGRSCGPWQPEPRGDPGPENRGARPLAAETQGGIAMAKAADDEMGFPEHKSDRSVYRYYVDKFCELFCQCGSQSGFGWLRSPARFQRNSTFAA